jgi:hypothetical protein
MSTTNFNARRRRRKEELPLSMYAITDTQGNHRNLNQNTINSTLTSES